MLFFWEFSSHLCTFFTIFFCRIYGIFCWINALFCRFCRDRRLRASSKIFCYNLWIFLLGTLWSDVGPIKKWSECWVEFKQLSQHVGRSLSHSHKAQFSGHCGLTILACDKFRPLHLHNRTHQLCICQNNKQLPIWRTSAYHSFCA